MTRPLVLVTGGAGFLGTRLCRFLLQRGFAVRSLDITPGRQQERASLEFIRGDIRDAAVVAEAMRDVGYVVHAASASAAQPDNVICSAGVMGTWNVLRMAARNGIRRVVFLSSAAVYGAQEHHLMHEADELRGCGSYAESKIQAEHLCQDARLGGVCVSILRCAEIVGPGRSGSFERLFDVASRGRHFRMSGAGGQPCQVLDVEDVCDAIHRCLVMRAELANDTFNIGSSDFATVRECLQAVLDSAGYGKRVIGWCPWRRVAVGADNSLSVRHSETRLDFRPRHAARAALIRQYTGYLRLHEIPCQPQPQHAPLVIFRQPTSYSTEAGVAEQ